MSEPASAGRLPRVAIVGRPNVGKSTLLNRLASRRRSIVGPTEGLTRDRVSTEVEWRGKKFQLSDTGGLVDAALREGAQGSIAAKMSTHAMKAVDEADAVLFVVDATTGVTAEDQVLAKRLSRVNVPVLIVANKADDPSTDEVSAMWALGLGEPLAVSAVHGHGSGEILDRLIEVLPEEASAPAEDPMPSIAIVGRPNVGKSSILNSLVGEEQAIVHDEPGTTRDSIDSVANVDGKVYRFIDTAGLRRRARTRGVAVAATSRTNEAIHRADLAIIVVDSSEGVTSQDQRIAEAVAEAGVGALVAMNKWDLVKEEEMAERVLRSIDDRLHFLSHAPVVRTSAVTGRGINKLVGHIDEVLRARNQRVPTSQLNRLVQEAQQQTPPPRARNLNVRIRYASQVGTAPPKVVLFSNAPVAESWLRFLERRMRESFGFAGNPIKMTVRTRKPKRSE